MIKKLLLCLLSATMLSMGWLGMSGIPLVAALVPLMWIGSRASSSRRPFWSMAGWCALTFGLWSAATTWWIWKAAPIGAILSVVITILLAGGSFMLYHYAYSRTPRVMACAILVCAWIAAEYIYTVGEISFPWLTLGNGMAHAVRLVQWYDTTGVLGGSLWLLLCNIFLFEVLQRHTLRNIICAAAIIVLPATVSLVKYYTWKDSTVKVEVAVIQPNLDPYLDKFSMQQQQQTDLMLDLIRQAPSSTDYIITPETALTETIREETLADDAQLAPFRSLTHSEFPHAQIILGATTSHYYMRKGATPTARDAGSGLWYDYFNSVLAVDSTSVQLRHKSVLVVGVEKIPYYALFKHVESMIVDLGGISGQLGYDPAPRVFSSPSGCISGTGICYEGVYGNYMGGFVTRGAQILFIISNDGWWGDTPGYRQLFALARLRAIEQRRDIARSANTGMSGMIDGRGRVLCSMGWDKRGTLTGQLSLNDTVTFYARHGDYLGRFACWGFVILLPGFIVYRLAGRKKRRS